MKLTPEIMHKLTKNINMGPDDNCWEWLGSTTKYGYPKIRLYGRYMQVTYFTSLWILGKGAHVVRHACGSKTCVNPHHLEIMTYTNNHKD